MSLKSWTAQALMRQLIARRALRKPILKEVSKRAYRALVEESKYDIPLQVRLDQYDYLMALVAAFDRAVEQRLVGKDVLRKLVGIFIQHMYWESEQKRASAPSDQVVPFFMVISPTGRCNLHCKGCYADSDAASRSSLDFETFERMLNEKATLWGSHFTVISGGEPFLWKDGEHDLLDMAARHPTDLFMVYTNGTFISDEVAARMAELGNITPAISVEGFEEETDARRGKGVYRRILNAFANLRRHGVPFGISVTPTALRVAVPVHAHRSRGVSPDNGPAQGTGGDAAAHTASGQGEEDIRGRLLEQRHRKQWLHLRRALRRLHLR